MQTAKEGRILIISCIDGCRHPPPTPHLYNYLSFQISAITNTCILNMTLLGCWYSLLILEADTQIQLRLLMTESPLVISWLSTMGHATWGQMTWSLLSPETTVSIVDWRHHSLHHLLLCYYIIVLLLKDCLAFTADLLWKLTFTSGIIDLM